MTMLIWALIYAHEIESKFIKTTRDVELKLFFKPVKYDSLVLAFLEYEYDGIQMKKILNAVAIQSKTNIWLEGKEINVKLISENFLTPQINKPYLLKVGDLDVADSGTFPSTGVLSLQKVSTVLFSLNGEKVPLQLFVKD
jgi:hypothetical protein